MRDFRLLRGTWIALALLAGGMGLPRLHAQDAAPDWYIQDGKWKSRALPVGDIFQLRLDGRLLTAGIRKKENAASPAPDAASGNKLTFIFDGKPVSVKREMVFDPSRQAIRILDVFTNTDDKERSVRIGYSTSLGDRGGVRYNGILMPDGSAREYGQGVPDDAPGAIVLAERDGTDGVPLFLWGQQEARWHSGVRDIGSTLNLNYEGSLPAGGRVALLHWVATAGLERGVRLEQGFDKLFKDGHLVKPMVPEDLVPLVANFKPDALRQEPEPVAMAPTAHRLMLLEDLCEKRKLKREAKDFLALGGDQQLSGNATLGKVSIRTRGAALEVPSTEVAAISGGAGSGRLHHLYLRDGSVLAGEVILSNATLQTPGGIVSLTGDGLDLLILRSLPQDGQWPQQAAGFVHTQQGELLWLSQPCSSLEVATSFGSLPLPPEELWLAERRREPAVSLVVNLGDGSRLQGVPIAGTLSFQARMLGSLSLASGELVRWGRPEALEKNAPEGDAVKGLADNHCLLRDGSVLTGSLADESVLMLSAAGQSTIKVSDILRVDHKIAEETTAELTGGSKFKGSLISDVIHWKFHGQILVLPASLVVEIVRKEAAAPDPASPEPAAKTTAPAVGTAP